MIGGITQEELDFGSLDFQRKSIVGKGHVSSKNIFSGLMKHSPREFDLDFDQMGSLSIDPMDYLCSGKSSEYDAHSYSMPARSIEMLEEDCPFSYEPIHQL
jgi:hypothetical protein